MAKFILIEPGYGCFFGDAIVYSASASGDIRIDYESKITHIQTYQNSPINVRYGNIGDLIPAHLQSKVLDMIFQGKKVDVQEYGHLCAVAGSMLIAQGQKVLDGGGYKSDTILTIFGAPYQTVKTATQKILSGCANAKMAVLTIIEQDTTGNNPALGNWEGMEETVWAGAAIN